MISNNDTFNEIYPLCSHVLGAEDWACLTETFGKNLSPKVFADKLVSGEGAVAIPAYLSELARLEWCYHSVSLNQTEIRKEVDTVELNPSLEVLKLSWRLVHLLGTENRVSWVEPEQGEEWVFIWRDLNSSDIKVVAATDSDLLALKIVVDEIAIEEAAIIGKVPVVSIHEILSQAAQKGLILMPRSRIVRNAANLSQRNEPPGQCIRADKFSIQWHITNTCDLHCQHCYDRTKRSPLTLEQGFKVLDNLYIFCKTHHVEGHVCFSGGNPFLSPHFLKLYFRAVEKGFSTSILGNPVPRQQLATITAIQFPGYFQVSLEGLHDHNDTIRGKGNFDRVIEFLTVLRELGVSSAVMLTLTADNIDQVIPLAEILRDKADYFTFNRLSPVGEGARLKLPGREQYIAFLTSYVDAAQDNPILGFKDNLINIELHKRGMEFFDGCGGFGCSAAFNFVIVLPDGEVHACRKFPSLIGNVTQQTLNDIYDSTLAQRYRQGSSACQACPLKSVCGGCLAVTQGCGLKIFEDRDPFCFFDGADRAKIK